MVKTKTIPSVVEALEQLIESKNEFIIYLQDEIAWLRSIMQEDKIERVRKEVDFKASRGYKSNYARIREQVLSNKLKHTPYPITPETDFFKEKDYESIVLDKEVE